MNPSQRVVVTGIGAVSAFGWGVDALREGLESGQSQVVEPQVFDTSNHRTRLAGEVPERISPPWIPALDWKRLSRSDQFAVCAAIEAAHQAQLAEAGRPLGVFFGSSTAGMRECEEYVGRILNSRPGTPRLGFLGSQQLNGPGDAVARVLGATGPVQSFSVACASGPLAVTAASDALRQGEVAITVAGGADSLCHLTYGGFNALRSVDKRPSRPFREDRAGLSLGEGAGVLVLETLDRALDRGARPLVELCGFGSSCDGHHMTAPHPEGKGALFAMRQALAGAGLSPADVSFVNTHGTGTPHNDEAEARACASLFEDRLAQVPMTATKASVGHILGAAGALEAVASIVALTDRVVHPTPGGGETDPSLGIDLVLGTARPLDDQAVGISTSFAFGGANVALVLRRWSDSDD